MKNNGSLHKAFFVDRSQGDYVSSSSSEDFTKIPPRAHGAVQCTASDLRTFGDMTLCPHTLPLMDIGGTAGDTISGAQLRLHVQQYIHVRRVLVSCYMVSFFSDILIWDEQLLRDCCISALDVDIHARECGASVSITISTTISMKQSGIPSSKHNRTYRQ